MSVKFFGQFLVSTGEITAEDLRRALDLMDERNVPLGVLAQRQGILSEADATRINNEQRRQDRPFGELAVEQQLMTQVQLQALLDSQTASRLRIGEALVELGALDGTRLEETLSRYHADQQAYADLGASPPESLKSNRAAGVILDLLPRLILRTAQVRLKLGTPGIAEGHGLFEHAAEITMRGESDLSIALSANAEFCERSAQALLGGVLDAIPVELYSEALGEFLNVLAGNAVAALESQGHPHRLDPPRYEGFQLHGVAYPLVATHGRAVLMLMGS